jgi:hypothetical protein
MYDEYVRELDSDDVITFEEYRDNAINNLINNTYFKVLN